MIFIVQVSTYTIRDVVRTDNVVTLHPAVAPPRKLFVDVAPLERIEAADHTAAANAMLARLGRSDAFMVRYVATDPPDPCTVQVPPLEHAPALRILIMRAPTKASR